MDTKTPRFLLVEDDPLMQSMYSVKFNNAGLVLSGLPNADDNFLKKVLEFNPDVILMDINLGPNHSNGVVAAETLLLDEHTKNIPIIFFTNADIDELVQKAKKLSSYIGFLIKAEYIPSQIVLKVQELYNEFLKRKGV